MDLVQLRYFMAAAEHLNFTKAARAVYTSQSNISKQVAQLESELGVRLFDRHHVGAGLTPAGETLYEGLSDLLPRMERLVQTLRESAPPRLGTVRLGFCESMDVNRVAPRFFPGLQDWHELRAEIESYPMEKLTEQISTGGLDVGFLYSIYSAHSPGLRRVALTRNNPMLYYARTHPLAQKPGLCVEDFRDETFICRRRDPRRQTYNPFEALPFVPAKVVQANSLSSILLYLESGAGVTVLGQSQSFLGKDTIASLEIPVQASRKGGTDVVWLAENRNPALGPFLERLFGEFGMGAEMR